MSLIESRWESAGQKGKTVVQHVLSPFSKENQPLIEESMCQSVKAVEYLIEGHSFVDAMNRFN